MNENDRDTLFIEETEQVFFQKKHKLIKYTVFAVLFVLLITISQFLEKKYVIAVLYLISHFAIVFFAAKFLLKKIREKCDDFEKQFYDMTDEEFEYLLSRSTGFDIMFKTFYMLDGYIWVPDRLLMIPYSEIISARTQIIKRKGIIVIGANLFLQCKENQSYNIHINDFCAFAEEQLEFEKMLNKKLEKYSRASKNGGNI